MGGEVEVTRCGAGMDCRFACFCRLGDEEPRLEGEGRFAWDIDCGRWKGAELMGVEDDAPK